MRSTARFLASIVLLCTAGWASDAAAGKKPGPPAPEPPPPVSGTPPARAWHGFAGNGAPNAAASRLYVFGGSGSDWQSLDDLWYYSPFTGSWTRAPTGNTKPDPRNAMGWSCGAGRCVAANGSSVGYLKETWIYTESAASWAQLNCNRFLCPSGRRFPAMAYDPLRARHVLFGGAAQMTSFLDDTYTFDGSRWTAHVMAVRPPVRFAATATFARAPVNMVVLHGGTYLEQGNPYNYFATRCDLWAFDGSRWLPVTMRNAGPCLEFHNMTWSDADQALVVAGGYTLTNGYDLPSRDTWTFRFDGPTSGSWSKNPDPNFYACAYLARPGARMAYDAPSGKNVFFGGEENVVGLGAVRYDDTVVCE